MSRDPVAPSKERQNLRHVKEIADALERASLIAKHGWGNVNLSEAAGAFAAELASELRIRLNQIECDDDGMYWDEIPF